MENGRHVMFGSMPLRRCETHRLHHFAHCFAPNIRELNRRVKARRHCLWLKFENAASDHTDRHWVWQTSCFCGSVQQMIGEIIY